MGTDDTVSVGRVVNELWEDFATVKHDAGSSKVVWAGKEMFIIPI